MKIHLFVSGKGGVGKTTLATALTMSSYNKYQVLCVDKNWQNPDLSTLLFRDEDYSARGPSYVGAEQANITSVRSKNVYEIPNGISGFWNSLKNIIELEHRRSKPNLVIVDSCLHVNNIVSISDDEQNLVGDAFENLSNLGVTSLNLWFIWTLTAIHRPNEVKQIQNTLQSLAQESCDLFRVDRNLVHVINPYTVYSSNNLIDSVRSLFTPDHQKVFPALRKLLKAPVTAPMAFEDFIGYSQSATNRKVAEPESLLENIGDKIYFANNRQRPRNILPVHVFSPILRPDAMSDLDSNRKITQLAQDLGPAHKENSLSWALGRVLEDLIS